MTESAGFSDPHYRLVPHLRETGSRFLLHWWSYNDQNHVTVAKTVETAASSYEKALEKDEDAKVEALWQARLVLPPADIVCAVAKHRYREDLRSFKSWVCYMAKELLEQTGELPLGFRACPYEPREDARESEDYREDHIGCVLCDDRAVFWGGAPWSEVFEEKKALWRAKGWTKGRPGSRKPFDGDLAVPGDKLRVATGHFGDHSSGAVIEEASLRHVYNLCNREVLFFFHGEKMEVPRVFAELRGEAAARWAVKKEERDLKFRAEREAENKKTLETAKKLFDKS